MTTNRRRLLMIGLDGYEPTVGDRFMAAGKMPNLARIRDDSLRFDLEHGVEKFSGLTWEHLSSGRSPRTSGRWSAIHFDVNAYDVLQMPTEQVPFARDLPAKGLVFDCPYFDMAKADGVVGVVGWGAHDPGVPVQSSPPELGAELEERFGAFVGQESLYGFTWPSAERTKLIGRSLVEAAEQRTEVARYLLSERLTDWDYALVVTGELHSAIEPFWHGLDPDHPLHRLPSASVSADALEDVYVAIDRMVGVLVEAAPDANVLAFSMHGMGPNDSDVPSMVLLPELLHRWNFGEEILEPRSAWLHDDLPMLAEDEAYWHDAVGDRLRPVEPTFGEKLRGALRRNPDPAIDSDRRELGRSVEWIPATRYRAAWPRSRAFALPAYYHGRVRVNLQGREARGLVAPNDYSQVCDEVIALLNECTNADTGEPAVSRVERFADRPPQQLGETDADLEVVWNGNAVALDHPTLGRIGPVPHRRTGGHTGAFGMAYLSGPDLGSGECGARSSFDVVPTIFDLFGYEPPADLSGRSLLEGVT